MPTPANRIAFQGYPGAYSNLACRGAFPSMTPLPCPSFEDAFAAVREGKARLAMIPIDNSIAGRVADIHHLLPHSGLHIIGEYFQPVEHCLLGIKGTRIDRLKEVHSHVHALGQCRKTIKALGLKAIVHADTAGAAQDVAAWADPAKAAISSSLAAEIYGLKILKKNVEDEAGNTTRFLALSKSAKLPPRQKNKIYMTSLIFKVHNIPAALYKALGGFATNGINITKLESYLEGNKFHSAQFYCEFESHPDDVSFLYAIDELRFYAADIRMLGTYPAHAFRLKLKKSQ